MPESAGTVGFASGYDMILEICEKAAIPGEGLVISPLQHKAHRLAVASDEVRIFGRDSLGHVVGKDAANVICSDIYAFHPC